MLEELYGNAREAPRKVFAELFSKSDLFARRHRRFFC